MSSNGLSMRSGTRSVAVITKNSSASKTLSRMEKISSTLQKLETNSRKLTIEDRELTEATNNVIDYVNNFWKNLENYKAVENDKDTSDKVFDAKIQDKGRSLKDILKLFNESVVHSGVQTASGRYLGWIPGGGIPLAALGDFVAAATNKFVGNEVACPGGVNVENAVLKWAASIFGFDSGDYGGNICTGGSTGNLMCIAAARDNKNIRGVDYERAVVYTSNQIHFCTEKALKVLGMREGKLRKIKTDENYCMDINILKDTIEQDIKDGLKPFLIVATAGSTPCGAIDDMSQISLLAKKHNCWMHVDGAYGGFFHLVDELKPKFAGIEEADSIVIDLHKSLFLPYGSAILLAKRRKDLLYTFSYESSLIDKSADRNQSPADMSFELTKNFRGLRAWFPLLYHGVDLFKDALREKIHLANYAYKRMATMKYIDLGPPPQLTVFVFRFNFCGEICTKNQLNSFNKKMNLAFQEDGRAFLTNTELDGEFWMRVVVLAIRSHKKEIDDMIDMIENVYLNYMNCLKLSDTNLNGSISPYETPER